VEYSRILSSPSSANCSSSPSEIFSDVEQSTNVETDIDNTESQSEEESLDEEPIFGHTHAYSIRALESHLLYILRDHLDLAAGLIPDVYRRVVMALSGDAEGSYSAPSHGQTTSTSNQEHQITSSNHSTNTSPNIEPLKRGRGEEEEEEEEDNGEGSKRPRRNPGRTLGNFASLQLERRPTFACHFHKFDPNKYGGSAWIDRRFRTCVGPGPSPTQLRRIKYFYPPPHILLGRIRLSALT
jgi:hypothetical protein